MNLKTILKDGHTLEEWLGAIYQAQQVLRTLYKNAAHNTEPEAFPSLQALIKDCLEELQGYEKALPMDLFQPIVIEGAPHIAIRNNGATICFSPYSSFDLAHIETLGAAAYFSEIIDGIKAKDHLSGTYDQAAEQPYTREGGNIDLPGTFKALLYINGLPFTVSRVNYESLNFTQLHSLSIN